MWCLLFGFPVNLSSSSPRDLDPLQDPLGPCRRNLGWVSSDGPTWFELLPHLKSFSDDLAGPAKERGDIYISGYDRKDRQGNRKISKNYTIYFEIAIDIFANYFLAWFPC